MADEPTDDKLLDIYESARKIGPQRYDYRAGLRALEASGYERGVSEERERWEKTVTGQAFAVGNDRGRQDAARDILADEAWTGARTAQAHFARIAEGNTDRG